MINHNQQNSTNSWISSVLDPERGVCADPVGRDAILGVGGPGRQLSPDRGMRRRDEMFGSKEDDPITASRNDHGQSKCQCAWPATSVNTYCSIVFIVLLFQENYYY
jgi:hypothetical protein